MYFHDGLLSVRIWITIAQTLGGITFEWLRRALDWTETNLWKDRM